MNADLNRREMLGILSSAVLGGASVHRYSFWVMGLLKPSALLIRAGVETRLHCYSPVGAFILEPGGNTIVTPASVPFTAAGPDDSAAGFTLTIPGVFERRYSGHLSVFAQAETLIPVITMDPEIAVSSIVGAELPASGCSKDALMAQAVVARSFLAATASPRHPHAFFCDTTHCQYLRSPAHPPNMVAGCAEATRALILTWQGKMFAARYSAACGGTTEGGVYDGVPYESVVCATCQQLRVTRRGHGWGLCQEGAIGLGRSGSSWPQILSAYYPHASVSAIRPG